MEGIQSFYEKVFKNADYELYDIDLESTLQPHSIPTLYNSTSNFLDEIKTIKCFKGHGKLQVA